MKRRIAGWSSLALLLLVTAGADAPKGQEAGGKAAASLPLSEVVLYSSGVGYFRRDGAVDGDAKVELRFKVDDINDLLKSLVVQDLDGGRVTSVTYGSRDPITKTLKSFAVDLTETTGLGDLLGQVRGERVRVEVPPRAVTGKILGVEVKEQPAGKDGERVVEVEYLNLLTEEGLRSIPLAQVQSVTLLDEALDAELRQALDVLASGHDSQKKTVAIRFDGEGRRRVGVAYITETPVWKTAYRLVLSDEESPYLQGWAIVENTSDDDWNDVRLSLVSGRPISFQMDLYQPLYATRPVVEPELYASLRPQVYGQALEERAAEVADAMPPPPPAGAPAAPGMGGAMGTMMGGYASVPRAARARSMPGMTAAEPMAAAMADKSRLAIQQGATAGASGLQAGELFQYAIKTPVTLARQKSAMLPILGEDVGGEKLAIYNESVQPKHPLNGFRLKNTTSLHLMQGPITVFDDDAYAGDARIEDTAPGQERLISYALDLNTEVEPQNKGGRQVLVAARLRKGTILLTHKATETKVYTVRNRDTKPKTVLIEHPFRSDWDLKEPAEPAERTRDVYRFRLKVEPGKAETLTVREERQFDQSIALTNLDSNAIAFYLRSREVSQAVKDALERVVGLRDALNATVAERERRETRVKEITEEQARIRENMARLAQNSELYTRYVKKLDAQESELERLREEIESIKDREARQRRELDEFLLGLDVG